MGALREGQNVLDHLSTNASSDMENPQPARAKASSALLLSSNRDYSLECSDGSSRFRHSLKSSRGSNGLEERNAGRRDMGHSGVSIGDRGKSMCTWRNGDAGGGSRAPCIKEKQERRTDTIQSDSGDAPIHLFLEVETGIDSAKEIQKRAGTLESSTNVLARQQSLGTKRKVSHCGLHGRDYSDCIQLHFTRPLQRSSHRTVVKILEEAVGIFSTTCSMRNSDCRDGYMQDLNSKKLMSRMGSNDSLGARSSKSADEHTYWRNGELSNQDITDERSFPQRQPLEFTSNARDVEWDSTVRLLSVRNSLASHVPHPVARSRKSIGNSREEIENGEKLRFVIENARPLFDQELGRLSRRRCRKIVVAVEGSGQCNVQKAKTGSNPLELLGTDMMLKILFRLDACSLARCGVLSKDWKALAYLDSLWDSQCVKLWEGKRHLPCCALQEGLPKVVAYGRSVQDANRAAPAYWLSLDPAQRGDAPMKRFFHIDGSHTAGPGDEVWGGHECFYSIVKEMSIDGTKMEHFVQINHWPYMSVSRTEDWGWVLNNSVYDYQSMPDAWKQGGSGPFPVC